MDLPLPLDRASRRPLHRQLTDQLRGAITGGRLRAGTQLPSTRMLAADLAVSRNVVVTAYEELIGEGYLESRHGSSTRVATGITPGPRSPAVTPSGVPRWLQGITPPDPPPPVGPDVIEFRPGKPSTAALPAAVWRRTWREVGATPPPADYGSPAGDPDLRAEIARYLRVARGVTCTDEDVLITTGAVQAIALIIRATVAPGDPVAFEEPGPPPVRDILRARGARIVPVPVDEDGLRVECLPTGEHSPAVVFTTPSHQYPLGGRLPVARRWALLDWARANDSLIIEDDYDSEFRYDAPPLPALAGLEDSRRVAYVGTFSKVLSPALRVGYVVAPPLLRKRIAALKPITDYHTPWPVQRALAGFIAGGHLARHVARMRRHYAVQRAVLQAGLAPATAHFRYLGLNAGLHVCLELAPGLDAAVVAATVADQGVLVTTLASCYTSTPDRQGLILGYGGLTDDQLRRGTAILAAALRVYSDAA